MKSIIRSGIASKEGCSISSSHLLNDFSISEKSSFSPLSLLAEAPSGGMNSENRALIKLD